MPNLSADLAGGIPSGYLKQNECAMPRTLTDRLYEAIRSSAQQADRAEKAQRLLSLLAKNPEVAEILDLIEQGRF